MAWVDFLPGQVNSPSTTLTGDINDVVDVIPVAELGVFPAAPGLAVIGTGDTAETIHYAAKSAATGAGNLTGCTRAYDSDGTYGVAASWSTGETIARNFCAHDFETICGNIEDHNSRHESGGADAIKLDDLAAPDDNTDLDVSVSAHGLCPKAPNVAAQYLNGVGAWDTVQETDLGFSDLTTSNVSTTKHGFAPKAPATYTFLSGYDGGWGNQLAMLGIGVAPSYLLHIKGTAATGLPTYSAEFLDADNWTSTDWTGSWAAGWDHTTGNTTVLSHDHPAVNATKYQITYTVSGRTAGTFTITFGGQTSAAISASGAWGPTTTGTGVLQITPTSDFDGAIIISIKSITAAATPIQVIQNSSGDNVLEIYGNNLNTNISIGVDSGEYTTTGVGNIFIGYTAGTKNTTGRYNIGIGSAVLYKNTVGYNNIAFGANALYNNVSGYFNYALGNNSLFTNTSGYLNFVFGLEGMHYNTTGYENVCGGYQSLYTLTEGYRNTCFGHYSGKTLTTGYNNVFIGYTAGANTNQLVNPSNSMGIGKGTFTTRSNQVVIGDASVVETHLRTGVYIGSTSTTAHTQPTARLHIAAGSATAGTAPIKLTSGTLNTTAEAGAIEFLTDDYYASITTGPARKKIALARSDWGAWVPTLVWGTADPAAITTVARYCQIDRVVFFHVDISSADSNAASSLTITLPVDPVDNNDYTAVSSREIAGAGGATWSDPLGYINMDSADKKINFAAFTAGTDGQAIRIVVSGSYEVA